MTLEQFKELKKFLDEFDIYYEEGNYYENSSKGEAICGHWLEIKETLFDTSIVSQEDE